MLDTMSETETQEKDYTILLNRNEIEDNCKQEREGVIIENHFKRAKLNNDENTDGLQNFVWVQYENNPEMHLKHTTEGDRFETTSDTVYQLKSNTEIVSEQQQTTPEFVPAIVPEQPNFYYIVMPNGTDKPEIAVISSENITGSFLLNSKPAETLSNPIFINGNETSVISAPIILTANPANSVILNTQDPNVVTAPAVIINNSAPEASTTVVNQSEACSVITTNDSAVSIPVINHSPIVLDSDSNDCKIVSETNKSKEKFLVMHKEPQVTEITKEFEAETVFICDVCHQQFKQNKDLQQHYENKHLDMSLDLKCKKCFIYFPSLLKLHHHKCATIVDVNTILSNGQKFGNNTTNSQVKAYHFNCTFCKVLYVNLSQILLHFNQQHKFNSILYSCTYCDFSVNSFLTLEKHFQANHLPPEGKIVIVNSRKNEKLPKKSSYCSRCFLIFKTKKDCVNHIHQIHPQFPCLFCPLNLGSTVYLQEHMQFKHHVCFACNIQFESYEDMLVHNRYHMNDKVFTYQCSLCSIKTRCRKLLCDHFKLYHASSKLNISDCKVVVNLPTLRKDNFLNNSDKQQCFYCCKLVNKSDVDSHLESEHNVFKCKACKGRVSSVGLYNVCAHCGTSNTVRHEVRMPDLIQELKEFECLNCFKFFTTYKSYCAHMLQCDPKASFDKSVIKCTKCFMYIPSTLMQKHISLHSKLDVYLPCLHCKGLFPRKSLIIHLNHYHKHCIGCNTRFNSTEAFNEHLADHNKDDVVTYQCNLCEEKLFDGKSMQTHVKIDHFIEYAAVEHEDITKFYTPSTKKGLPGIIKDEELLKSFVVQCPYCGDTMKDLGEHLKTHGVYTCSQCCDTSLSNYCKPCNAFS